MKDSYTEQLKLIHSTTLLQKGYFSPSDKNFVQGHLKGTWLKFKLVFDTN